LHFQSVIIKPDAAKCRGNARAVRVAAGQAHRRLVGVVRAMRKANAKK
jgi:hypothetical protein